MDRLFRWKSHKAQEDVSNPTYRGNTRERRRNLHWIMQIDRRAIKVPGKTEGSDVSGDNSPVLSLPPVLSPTFGDVIVTTGIARLENDTESPVSRGTVLKRYRPARDVSISLVGRERCSVPRGFSDLGGKAA